MSPMTHAFRVVLWLLATGLVVIGALNIGLEATRHELHHTELSVWRCLVWSVPIVLGMILFAGSRAIAQWLSDHFEE